MKQRFGLRQLDTIILCGFVNAIGGSAFAGYEFSVSESPTDPSDHVATSPLGSSALYLWLECGSSGISAAEGDLEGSIEVLGFTPSTGVLNLGGPTSLLLGVSGCDSTRLLGTIYVNDEQGGTLLFDGAGTALEPLAVDCAIPNPNGHPSYSRGFVSEAAPVPECGMGFECSVSNLGACEGGIETFITFNNWAVGSDYDAGANAERLLISTLQGLVDSGPERIWIDHGWVDRRWLFDISDQFDIEIDSTHADDVWWFVDHFADYVDGYLLCDADNASISVACALAGHVNAVVVEQMLEQDALTHGLPKLCASCNLEQRDEFWLKANYWDQSGSIDGLPIVFTRRELHTQSDPTQPQNPWHTYLTRDYGVRNRLFTVDAKSGNVAFLGSLARDLDTDGMVSGSWFAGGGGQPDNEVAFVAELSRAGTGMNLNTGAQNLSVLNEFTCLSDYLRQERFSDNLPLEDVHYVAFLVSDGDSRHVLMKDMVDWIDATSALGIPMNWEVAASAVSNAPAIIRHYYDTENARPSKLNYFVAANSGATYSYPSLIPGWEQEVAAIVSLMGLADMRVSAIRDNLNAVDAKQRFYGLGTLLDADVAGVIYKAGFGAGYGVDRNGYGNGQGATLWHGGKPAISPRFMLGKDAAIRAHQAAAISNSPRDPRHDVSSYTVISINPWDHPFAGAGESIDEHVQDLVSQLGPAVEVVTLDEMVGTMAILFGPDFEDQTFEAESAAYSHGCGYAIQDGWAKEAGGVTCHMSFGPYLWGLPKGQHVAVFRLAVDVIDANNDDVVELDVRNNALGGDVFLAQRTVKRHEFKADLTYQEFPVSFIADGTEQLEFRVKHLATSYVKHDYTRVMPVTAPTQVFEAEGSQYLHECGASTGDAWAVGVWSQNCFLAYGPYTRGDEEGERVARFRLLIDNNSTTNDLVARIDVRNNTDNETLSSQDLYRYDWDQANAFQEFPLMYVVAPDDVGDEFEYRVYYYHHAYIAFDRVLLEPVGFANHLIEPEVTPVPEGETLAADLYVSQARPNPTVESVVFEVRSSQAGRWGVRIYDVTGRLVWQDERGEMQPGARQMVRWDGRDRAGQRVASGVYFARFDVGKSSVVRKVALLR